MSWIKICTSISISKIPIKLEEFNELFVIVTSAGILQKLVSFVVKSAIGGDVIGKLVFQTPLP